MAENVTPAKSTAKGTAQKSVKGAAQKVAAESGRGWTVPFALGLGAQIVFWCFVFLALAVAIGTGGHLTEFRYVGF